MGRHIDSKTEAIEEAERIRIGIRNGTFRAAESEQTEARADAVTLETYARQDWLPSAEQNLKVSGVETSRNPASIHSRGMRLLTWSRSQGSTFQNGIRGCFADCERDCEPSSWHCNGATSTGAAGLSNCSATWCAES